MGICRADVDGLLRDLRALLRFRLLSCSESSSLLDGGVVSALPPPAVRRLIAEATEPSSSESVSGGFRGFMSSRVRAEKLA